MRWTPSQPGMAPLNVWREKYVTPTSRLDSVISLCKRRGFVFPSGEIYGGTRSAWDY